MNHDIFGPMRKTDKGATGKSRFRSIVGLALAIIGLWFGFFVLNIAGRAGDAGGGEKALQIVFGIVWFTFWIGAMVYNALNYFARSRSSRTGSPSKGDGEERADFDTRLRKLESLKEDGLLSENEYLRKREELLKEKW